MNIPNQKQSKYDRLCAELKNCLNAELLETNFNKAREELLNEFNRFRKIPPATLLFNYIDLVDEKPVFNSSHISFAIESREQKHEKVVEIANAQASLFERKGILYQATMFSDCLMSVFPKDSDIAKQVKENGRYDTNLAKGIKKTDVLAILSMNMKKDVTTKLFPYTLQKGEIIFDTEDSEIYKIVNASSTTVESPLMEEFFANYIKSIVSNIQSL